MSDIEISCTNVTLTDMDRNVNQVADVNIKQITNLLNRNYFHDKDLFLDLWMTNCSLEEKKYFSLNCTDQSGYNVLCNKTNSTKFSNSVLEIGDAYTQKSLLAEQSLILSTESSVGNTCHRDCKKIKNGYSSTLSGTSQQKPNVSISDSEKNGSTSLCQDDCPGEELPQGDEPIDGEPSVADLEALCQPCHQVCHYRQNAPVRCGCYHGFAITSNWLHCIDVDECSLHPQLCHGGWCLNIIGSFMCHCPPGYQLVGHTCIDLDECQSRVCDQVCINVPGSYQCRCRSGFQPSFPGSRSCADVDECQHPVCSHACINTVGSFFCHCPSGWRLQSDDRTCLPSDLSNGIIESAKRVIILKDSKNPHEETSITFTKSGSKSGRRMVVLSSDKEIPNNPVLKNVGYSSFRAIPSKMERNSGERQDKQLKLNVGGSTTRNLLTREVKFDCVRHPASCSTERYKPCVPSCKNGGVCNGKGVCHCTAGFQGRYCQIDRNECIEKPSPCSYMCINSFGGYQCVCPSGQVLADDGKSCVGATTRSAKTLSVLIEVVVEPSPTATLAPTNPFPEHIVFNTGVGAFLPHKGLTVENLVTEVVNKSGVIVPDKSSLPITSSVVREESNSTFEKIQPTKVSETIVSSDLVLVQLFKNNSTSSDTSSQVNFTLFSTVFESSSELSELTASFDDLVTDAEPLDIEKQGNFTSDMLNITVPPTLDELKVPLPTIDATGNLIMSSDNGIIAKSDDGPVNPIMPSASVLNDSGSILSPTDIISSHIPVLPLPTKTETLSNLTVVLSTSKVLMPDSSSSDTAESLFITSMEDDSDGKIGKEINMKNDQLPGKVTKPRKNKHKEDKLKGGKEKDKLKVKKKHKTKIKVVKLTKDFQILNVSGIQEEVKNLSLENDLKSGVGMKESDSGVRYFEVIDYDDDSFLPVKYNSSDPFNIVPPAVVPAPLPTYATRPHLNEKDCYYGSNRIKSRTSFYRDNNNCTKCVCKDGELRCAPRHCPPLHCEVPLHGDCCDYCPSDCVVDRDVYLTGERFSPALDPCRECRCKSGRAVCDNIKCQALDCPEQFRYLLPGECCPVCKPPEPGCFSRGRFFYQGQLWVRQEGGCHACLCKDGEIQCNPVVCVVNCQHPQFIPGECCPLCEGCQHYNQKYSDQQMFPHPTDPCSICQCQNGNISCYHKPCSTECSHPYQSPGECCPQCFDCNFSGQRLRNSSSIAVNLNGTCQECSCVRGNVSCAPSPCTASCVVEGKELPSGAEFNLGSDPCTHCRCTNGVVSCQAVECASTCSHGVLLPDTCCLDCSKCDYQGRLFSEMEVFRPPDESCKSCLCVKGNVICQDTCSISPLD
ncbi:uncharacterized protein [Anabrus simplex]|uniref:uncharacterized protein n=1 Tax=Anabrus simplex TaxID=316456 RepID=UPI0035A2DCF8